jgi:streptogramin lyase
VGVTALRSRASGGKLIRAGSVGVVDQLTREIVEEIPVESSSPLIAADDVAVWVLDANRSTLTKIDPDENVVVWTRGIQAGGRPTALAAGEGSVWIALNEGFALSVLEVEPGLGDVRNRYGLARGDHVRSESLEGVELTVGEGWVWALERGVGQVTRIDPATDDDQPFAEGLGASSSIAVLGAVWLGGIAGVTKLDLRTGRELRTEFVAPVIESTNTSIAIGRDAVWFVGDSDARLWRIDPLTVTSLDAVPLGAGRPSAVAVADDEAVWVAGGSAGSLWRVDPGASQPETIEIGSTSGGLVAAFGGIWTSPGASAG